MCCLKCTRSRSRHSASSSRCAGKQQRSARRLVTAARLDADKAVFDQINPADGIAPANFVQQLDQRNRIQLHAVHRDRHSLLRTRSSTFSSRSGASCGDFVHVHVLGSGALFGSSSSPPSWLTCQQVAVAAVDLLAARGHGNACASRRSRGSLRATSDVHSRHGAITFSSGASAW